MSHSSIERWLRELYRVIDWDSHWAGRRTEWAIIHPSQFEQLRLAAERDREAARRRDARRQRRDRKRRRGW